MDQRDPMALSGSGSFYTQRGIAIPGSGTQPGMPGIHPMTNQSFSFQSDTRAGSMGSTLPMEPPSHGVNVGAPSVVPPTDPFQRKRGRPRKYGPDGNISLALSTSPSISTGMAAPAPKRNRGRPPGSGKKEKMASLGERLPASAGMALTTHVILIAENEDIEEKIRSFSQQGPRAVCILSAHGSVSTVALRQPSTSSGTVIYEGLFEIICLSGLYLPNDSGDSQNQRESLTISLATSDGSVIGGGVGARLIAASPVEVILGSFIWGDPKGKNKKREHEEGPAESDNQLLENPIALDSIPPNQSLKPTSSMGGWPTSRNMHDIDLMLG